MNREEKNKFGNFVHEQRKKEEEVLEICQDIFANSRNELAVSMRYFQSALSALKIVPSGETQVLGTDGKLLYVSPQWLLPMFMQNKVVINRLYLHELLHCLFCHLWSRKEREWRIWDLAADIAVENILDELYQKAVYIRPNSFRREKYQQWKVEHKVLAAEILYSKVREYVGDTRDKVVFDLYSGTGTIAQLAASVASEVIGVEIVEDAVKAARVNAALNNINNCRFIAGDVLKVLDDVPEKPDVIILDPPRDGVHPKALPKILAYGVDQIVYISCKVTSLVRDLPAFYEAGYEMTHACAVDQFCQGVHVETVCLLSNRNRMTR